MLNEQLREEWRARERAVPIYPVMTFAPDGLVLGAGTILLQADGPVGCKACAARKHGSSHCWPQPTGRQWRRPSWETLNAP